MAPSRYHRPVQSGVTWSRPWSSTSGEVHVQGHRGALGLVPENTLPSFRQAIESGCAGVELDVRLSADGHLVVWHDPTLLAAKCTFTGPDLTDARVDDLSLEQLRTVDIGRRTLAAYPRQRGMPQSRILTLGELFAAVAPEHPELSWTVEVKVDPTDPREVATRRQLVEGVISAIHDAGLTDRALLHSFDWAVLELGRELDPRLARSALAIVGLTYGPGSRWLGSVRFEDHRADLAAAAAAAGACVVAPYYLSCTADLVARAHELGLSVLAWTVNTPAELQRMRAIGVDAVVTDYPDIAVPLLHDDPSRI